VEDAQAMVLTLAEDRSQNRPAIFNTLDRIILSVQGAIQQTVLVPRRAFKTTSFQPMDLLQLEQAIRTENLGLWDQAARLYERLLKTYPDDPNRFVVALRLAHLYQYLQDFDRAQDLCRIVIRQSTQRAEIHLAYQMLETLKKNRARLKEVQRLQKALASAPSQTKRHEIAYQLGSVYLAMFNLPQAAVAFEEAYRSNPEGPLAFQALFKAGWCLKRMGRFDDAFDHFLKVIRLQPGGEWIAASYQQMAETYRLRGDYQTAASLYEEVIQKSGNMAMDAAIRTQVGSIYLYDLRDMKQAQAHFQAVVQFYPASPFSAFGQILAAIQKSKGIAEEPFGSLPQKPSPDLSPSTPTPPSGTPSIQLTAGAPLLNWMERFLPLFVDVFCQRLARYMQMSDVKVLERAFSESEFRTLVLKRVEETFPGQVKDVHAEIHENGFVGSGTVRLGMLNVPIRARIGIVVRNERPLTVIHEIYVGAIAIPESLRKLLEERVNRAIEKARYPLKVKSYQLYEGYAKIAVELVE
jgi:tetratricopeptide (TPR) repeat protein